MPQCARSTEVPTRAHTEDSDPSRPCVSAQSFFGGAALGFELRASHLLGSPLTLPALVCLFFPVMFFFFKIGSHEVFNQADLKLQSSDLCLLTSWDYRREPRCLAFSTVLWPHCFLWTLLPQSPKPAGSRGARAGSLFLLASSYFGLLPLPHAFAVDLAALPHTQACTPAFVAGLLPADMASSSPDNPVLPIPSVRKKSPRSASYLL
jgi:hypothetical protein